LKGKIMERFLVVLLFAAATPCFSQGTVNFANGAAGVDAPVTNGIVGGPPFVRADNRFRAQLYAGPGGITDARLLTTNGISGTPATFLSGGGAGYFLGNARDIDGYPPGTTVTLQVRAWLIDSGSSWETAWGRGESNLIQITLGGGTIPTPNMVGLHGFIVPLGVPEPSSVALGLIGLLTIAVIGTKRRSRGG
jgi:hypothetical protein